MPKIVPLPPDYAALLTDIRQRVRLAQTRAVMASQCGVDPPVLGDWLPHRRATTT